MHEKIVLALGESTTLSATKGIKDDSNRLSKDGKGRWGSTGSAAVIESDDLEADSVKVVGASVGKVLVYYRQESKLTSEETLATSMGHASEKQRQIEDQYAVAFEVEVVAKKDAEGAKAAAAGAPSPLASSSKFDGLLPMNEVQEKPSEKTPYGTDQEGKPVAPFPGMVSPSDDSTVARQSEDAVATGSPGSPAAASKTASKKTASKKAAARGASKSSKK